VANCHTCGERMANDQSGSSCSLCLAKMINYAQGEYHDENDPAVQRFKKAAAEYQSPKSTPQGGCALLFAVMTFPAFLAAAGIGIENFLG